MKNHEAMKKTRKKKVNSRKNARNVGIQQKPKKSAQKSAKVTIRRGPRQSLDHPSLSAKGVVAIHCQENIMNRRKKSKKGSKNTENDFP